MAPRSVSGFVEKLDAWQQKRAVPGFFVAVVAKYRDDRGQQYAALLSYYGFISMFPLLIAFVSILSIVLKNEPTVRDKIIDGLIGRLPVIGTQIKTDASSVQVHGVLVVIGLATLLWAGLKVVRNAQNAFNEQWGVPYLERPGMVRQSIRGLAMLAVIGLAIVGRHGSHEPRRVRRLPWPHEGHRRARRDPPQRRAARRLVRAPHRGHARVPDAAARRRARRGRTLGWCSWSAEPTSSASSPTRATSTARSRRSSVCSSGSPCWPGWCSSRTR